MKKIIEIALTCSAVLAVTSCKGFMDLAPYDEISSKSVYASASLAEGAVIGAYSNIRYDFITTDATNWDAMSSVLDPNTLLNYNEYSYLMGTIQPSNGLFLNNWKRLYEGVNRANDVIGNISSVPEMDEGTKACRLAECKFIRAYCYYKLNALWQGVPIYKQNLAPSEYMKARSSAEDVWQFIIEDCTDCINTESLPMKYKKSDSNCGRVTKAAALFLRAKAYMWLKDWEKAKTDLLAIAGGGFSLFTGSYADLFKEANEKCDEMIFFLNMREESGCGNVYPFCYGNVKTAGGGWNRYFINTAFCDSYHWADGKPFSFDDVIPGYSNLTPKERSVYFLRDGLTDSEKSAMEAYGAKMSEYLPSGNEARIKAAYLNRDPRLDATVITPYEQYHGGYPEDGYFTSCFPYRQDNAGDLKTQYNQYDLYCIQKFVPEGRQYMNPSYNPVDVPIFRFADLLLCLAECENEQGRLEKAVDYVNQVRGRAGVALLNGSSEYVKVSSQSEMRKRIQEEKLWELACEEQLYFEEIRWGIWKENKFTRGVGLTQIWGDPVFTYKWEDCLKSWAIPASECEKNTNLKQNEGWF